MTMIPIVGFPMRNRAYQNITPFTYRDGLTYVEVLEGLRSYIRDTLVPHVNTEIAEIVEAWDAEVTALVDAVNSSLTAQTDFVSEEITTLITLVNDTVADNTLATDTKLADITSYVDTAIQQIIDSSVEVQDPVVAAMFDDTTSAARTVLDELLSKYGRQEHRFNVKTFGAVGDGVASDTLQIQAALDAASLVSGTVELNGAHVIDAKLNVPSNITIDGARGSIVQTANNTTSLSLIDVENVTLRDVRSVGKRTDYVNASSVYSAAAIYLGGTTNNVKIINCTLEGHAGVGVFIATGATKTVIADCTISGPGAEFITGITYNYGAGVVALGNDWIVQGCDISDYAQGISTGDNMRDCRVINNFVHDIVGQHGFYLDSLASGVISGNIVERVGLAGMKVQITDSATSDAENIVIIGNVFKDCGAQGILVTNVAAIKTYKARSVVITGNTVDTAGSGGIEANNAIGLIVADNYVRLSQTGVKITDCSDVTVQGNTIRQTVRQGILVNAAIDYTVRANRVVNPATANEAQYEFGIFIVGETTADGRIDSNKVTDELGNMKHGIYFVSGEYATHSFTDNHVAGTGVDYGIRLTTPSKVREWRGNNVSNTGGVSGAPTEASGSLGESFGPSAPTTGLHFRGEVVTSTVPAIGEPRGWVCIAAGTPGTWVSMGTL